MPLSTAQCVRCFLKQKRGRAARVISTGSRLLDYGWYTLAEWVEDTIRVNREPYPSVSSVQHHNIMRWELTRAGYAPVRLDDDPHYTIWTHNPPAYQKEKKEIREHNGYRIFYHLDLETTKGDWIAVITPEGQEAHFYPWQAAYERVLAAWERDDLTTIVRAAKQSLAATRAAETAKAKAEELKRKLTPLVLRLFDSLHAITKPITLVTPDGETVEITVPRFFGPDRRTIRAYGREIEIEINNGEFSLDRPYSNTRLYLPSVQLSDLYLLHRILKLPNLREQITMAVLAA